MNPADVLPYLTGPAAALAILLFWVWTLRKDLADERRRNEALQRRAEAGEEAARTSLAMINALTGRGHKGEGR